LAARQSGWYFLRFYDHGDDLLESLDFRFTTSLQDIRVGNHAPLPPVDGHGPVPVEFTHDPGCVVQPVDSPGDPLVMRGDEQATVCEIPPDAACDDLGFLVGRKGEPRVLVRVLAHRVWWALGDIGTCPSQWTDKAIALSRDLFLATSSHALWLRFPYPHWLDGVQVGFERKKARAYRIGVDSRELPIALRDFGDSTEVTNRHDECSLRVWIESDGRLIEGVLATLPSEAPPRGEPRGVGGEYLGLGRKKTATARAALRSGTGEITVNGAPLWQYFAGAPRRAKRFWRRLLDMDEVSKLLKQIDAQITVSGSTPTTMRQAGAAGHALARALGRHDMKMQNILRSRGFGGARVQKCFPLQSRVTASLREGQISCNDRLRDGDL
jgi:small subunit ribosomal protein S9